MNSNGEIRMELARSLFIHKKKDISNAHFLQIVIFPVNILLQV